MVETEDVRAVRGGTGEAKCGGNYGAANRAGERAEAKGYSQVLWLDGVERKYVEEGGGMNVMFKIGGKVVTPALTGSILPGRHPQAPPSSCCKSWGMPVEERLLSVDELFEAATHRRSGGGVVHRHRRRDLPHRCAGLGRRTLRGQQQARSAHCLRSSMTS